MSVEAFGEYLDISDRDITEADLEQMPEFATFNAAERKQAYNIIAGAPRADNTDKVAALLAVGFTFYTAWMIRRLREDLKKPASEFGDTSSQMASVVARSYSQAAAEVLPGWSVMLIPVIAQGIVLGMSDYSNVVMSQAEAYARARSRAGELTTQISATSLQALLEGVTAQRNRGLAPTLILNRTIDAFGVLPRTMKALVNIFMSKDHRLPLTTSTPKTQNWAANMADKMISRAILSRAGMIGDTEAYTLRTIGHDAVWSQMIADGIIPLHATKSWVTARDEIVCPSCGPMNNQQVLVSQDFVTSFGHQSGPPMHINCRCEAILDVDLSEFDDMAADGELVAKAGWGGDKWDRDSDGRFARQDTLGARGGSVLERPAAPATAPTFAPTPTFYGVGQSSGGGFTAPTFAPAANAPQVTSAQPLTAADFKPAVAAAPPAVAPLVEEDFKPAPLTTANFKPAPTGAPAFEPVPMDVAVVAQAREVATDESDGALLQAIHDVETEGKTVVEEERIATATQVASPTKKSTATFTYLNTPVFVFTDPSADFTIINDPHAGDTVHFSPDKHMATTDTYDYEAESWWQSAAEYSAQTMISSEAITFEQGGVTYRVVDSPVSEESLSDVMMSAARGDDLSSVRVPLDVVTSQGEETQIEVWGDEINDEVDIQPWIEESMPTVFRMDSGIAGMTELYPGPTGYASNPGAFTIDSVTEATSTMGYPVKFYNLTPFGEYDPEAVGGSVDLNYRDWEETSGSQGYDARRDDFDYRPEMPESHPWD